MKISTDKPCQQYSWYFGRLKSIRDVKINVVFPATEIHIRKVCALVSHDGCFLLMQLTIQYSKQDVFLVKETPEVYERVVKPFIAAFPPSRTKWVDEIIGGKKEVDKVLYRDDSGSFGYMIIPDMKWNLETLSDLYLLALCTTNGIRSLRDLRKVHLPVLKNIKNEATRIVNTRWKNEGREISLRMFVHYQPSYCTSLRCSQPLFTDLGISRSFPHSHCERQLSHGVRHGRRSSAPSR